MDPSLQTTEPFREPKEITRKKWSLEERVKDSFKWETVKFCSMFTSEDYAIEALP
ncbi:hypothetical protein FHS18_005529 [Paenibacillus phyllosphaerae]|uniref:Uncharacterized protein n=1 Tax=Paenibacillus phyllosphaerae TaxID=274593 RepID=A0A7W5B386_9BACL|nr:hypothetical protein [Paenibacillus phyllosphaerae]